MAAHEFLLLSPLKSLINAKACSAPYSAGMRINHTLLRLVLVG